MKRWVFILVAFALLRPAGLIERCAGEPDVKYAAIVDASADELTPTTENESEDPEFCHSGVLFFDSPARSGDSIASLQDSAAPGRDVDPLGCRPPPVRA